MSEVIRSSPFFKFGGLFWVLYLVLTVSLGLASQDELLLMLCLISLPIGARLLWREGEPPILFAMFFIQWLQISSGVFRSTAQGLDIVQSYQNPGVGESTTLALAGLMVLASGVHLVIRKIPSNLFDSVRVELENLSVSRVVVAYAVTSIIVTLFGGYFWAFGGLAQILFALISFKWAFYFVMAVTILYKREGVIWLILATVLEVIVGFSSFFSEYRHVFFVLGLAIFTSAPRIKRSSLVMVALVFVVVILFSVFWSIIKLEYRDFLSQGTGRQVVLVSPAERYGKLVELMDEIEMDDVREGFATLVDRIQYVAYFGHVVSYVPSAIPHAGGEITGAALKHILQPRLLFPEKAALAPDVLITEKYTGLDIIVQQGWHTEVPVGYMADLYIDFGRWGMFIPLFMLGLLYGWQYRFFIARPQYLIFAYGCISVIMKTAADVGTSLVKILGGNITAFVAIALAFQFVVPRFYYLLQEQRQPADPSRNGAGS